VKLRKVRVTEFKSIWDTGEFETGEITCLVGKNEAGKTAVLQALHRLNPVESDAPVFNVTSDYPRSEVEEYQIQVEAEEREHAVVVRATFGLSPEEVAAVEEEIGKGSLERPELDLSRGYKGNLFVSLAVKHPEAVAELVRRAELPGTLAVEFSACKSLHALEEKLAGIERTGIEEHLTRLEAQVAKIKASDSSFGLYAWRTVLKGTTPSFLYFDEYYQMRGVENIQALQRRVSEKKLLLSDHPLLGLIELARLKLEDLAAPQETQDLKNKLEGAGNYLSRKILKYWSQNKHISMRFDVRQALPEDPPGMTSGMNVWPEVYDSKHLATTQIGVRSHGFVWFFSFLAWFTMKQREKTPLILLLDEPGLALHGKAQEDLLRFMEVELREEHQVIYTTHSPFMVDPRHWERVRIVQDRGMEEDDVPREEDGTKVFTDVLQASEDSLFPLQGALGYEIHQTLFVGPNSLIVEGSSDLLYLETVRGVLERKGRVGLSDKWTITPVGGSDKVPAFVALLGAQKGMTLATLIDIQAKDRQSVENLYKKKLLKRKNVLTFGDFTGQTEADIEDMFGDDFYVGLVNAEFKGALASPIDPAKLPKGGPRVLVRLEKHFEKNPLKGGTRFSHYRPARYFAENVAALEANIPEAALKRFADAFKQLNALL
jgi:predicted ATPase